MLEFLKTTGFGLIANDPKSLIMIAIACLLLYLAIVKKFEPLLLLPIAFGMLLANLPLGGVMHPDLFLGKDIALSAAHSYSKYQSDHLSVPVPPRR